MEGHNTEEVALHVYYFLKYISLQNRFGTKKGQQLSTCRSHRQLSGSSQVPYKNDQSSASTPWPCDMSVMLGSYHCYGHLCFNTWDYEVSPCPHFHMEKGIRSPDKFFKIGVDVCCYLKLWLNIKALSITHTVVVIVVIIIILSTCYCICTESNFHRTVSNGFLCNWAPYSW